jgi:hypothetical protein
MKSNAQPPLYFSAYPLKTLNQETSAKSQTGQSPFLRSILSGKTRTLNSVRVLPMVNPYPQTQQPFIAKESKLPNDIELTEKEWFNNYE